MILNTIIIIIITQLGGGEKGESLRSRIWTQEDDIQVPNRKLMVFRGSINKPDTWAQELGPSPSTSSLGAHVIQRVCFLILCICPWSPCLTPGAMLRATMAKMTGTISVPCKAQFTHAISLPTPRLTNMATREALCRVTWMQSHASQLVSFPFPFCKLTCTHIHTATVFFCFQLCEDKGRFDSISSSILSKLTLILVHSHCSQIREMNLAHGATIQSWSKTNVLLGG